MGNAGKWLVLPLSTGILLYPALTAMANDSDIDVRRDALEKQVDLAFQKKQPERVVELCNQMLRLRLSPNPYKNICKAEEQMHNFKAAIIAIDKAMEAEKPEDKPKCLLIRARVYAESDQDNLAQLDLEKAAAEINQKADFYAEAAHSLERLDSFEVALPAIRKSLKLAPDDGKAQKTAGRILEHLKNYNEAAEHFEKATQLLPHESESWRHLAVIHSMQKKPEIVIADATNAIKMHDIGGMHLVETYRLRAEAYTCLGRFKEARQDYDSCIKISPLQRKLFLARAAVNAKLGDQKSADADLAKVRTLDASVQPFNGF